MVLSELDQQKLANWRANELAWTLKRMRTARMLKCTQESARKEYWRLVSRAPCLANETMYCS